MTADRPRRTLLLSLLVALAGVAAIIAWARLDHAKADALGAQREAASVHRDLAEIAAAGGGGAAATKADPAEIDRRLRQAASVAGIAEKLSTEPGNPARINNGDYVELPVFLHVPSLTMTQLTTFLHRLSTDDPNVRAKTIELAPPEAQPAPGEGAATTDQELWTADVQVAYLVYSPKGRGGGTAPQP